MQVTWSGSDDPVPIIWTMEDGARAVRHELHAALSVVAGCASVHGNRWISVGAILLRCRLGSGYAFGSLTGRPGHAA
jgi:hypothetical protein